MNFHLHYCVSQLDLRHKIHIIYPSYAAPVCSSLSHYSNQDSLPLESSGISSLAEISPVTLGRLLQVRRQGCSQWTLPRPHRSRALGAKAANSLRDRGGGAASRSENAAARSPIWNLLKRRGGARPRFGGPPRGPALSELICRVSFPTDSLLIRI